MTSQNPYHRINPDQAQSALAPPVNVSNFSKIADACAQGSAILAEQGLDDLGQKKLRRFSTWEITKYLIPVAQAHFRRVLRQNPELPQGTRETEVGAKWFTLEEVLELRKFFATEGAKSKEDYLPYRPLGLPAKVIAIANFKGGVGKTSTATHLAMSAALDGYKVLVVDCDSQGSITSILGGRVADEWQTVFPLLARHYGEHARAENMRRAEFGEEPRALDDTVAQAMEISALDLAQKTHWPNIDLIGAQLDLYWAEFQVPIWRMALRSWKLWDALGDSLAADAVLSRYDIIIIDTPPALGYLTINALAAADILLVPTGANYLEFESTGRFFDMLHATFSSIEEGENRAARALGRSGVSFEWDGVQAVLTRYDASQQAEFASFIQSYLGQTLSPHKQDYTALVGQATEQVGGIYEADYRDFNRETYARGRATFDETWAGVKKMLIGAWRRDEMAEQDVAEQRG